MPERAFDDLSCMGGAEPCRSPGYLLAADKDAGRNMGYVWTANLINSQTDGQLV